MAVGAAFAVSRALARRRGAGASAASPPVKVPLLPSNQSLLRSQGSSPAWIQPKLRLSHKGDPAEREADAVAEALVAGGLRPLSPALTSAPTQVSRVCAECEDELARQEDEAAAGEVEPEVEDDSEPDVSGMPKRTAGSPATHLSESVVPGGAGRSLPAEVQTTMESGFGTSFDSVRIHTDSASARSASRIGALAYTVGNHIYFGAGQYAPSSESGSKLLAHELTHVLQQQRSGDKIATQKGKGETKPNPPKSVCSPGDCPQGKQAKVVHSDCKDGGPEDENNFITHLEVSLSARTVTATWSGGKIESWPCSPNPRKTPARKDVVGVKCGINHTNLKKAGMAWFTSFKSTELCIGFHDSQPVGTGFRSHGCVRVCCDVARTINRNTWSQKTTISVS